MARREGGLEDTTATAGIMIARNPGVSCLWTTRSPGAAPFDDGAGGLLLNLFPPTALAWFREGRTATRAEVLESVESGLPQLRALAEQDGPEAVAELERLRGLAEPCWPRT
jgi:hypothetical protein